MLEKAFLYRDEPVITLWMMDEAHGLPRGTATRAFRRFREWMRDGTDYFELTDPDEIRRLAVWRPRRHKGAIVLLTASGCLRLPILAPWCCSAEFAVWWTGRIDELMTTGRVSVCREPEEAMLARLYGDEIAAVLCGMAGARG
jgi:hypothetical protein